MILNYLKAGYPCLYMLTQEPHRTEELLPCPGWKFTTWDCIQGIRVKGEQTVLDIINPTDTIQWLNTQQDTALIAHNLHLFLDDPQVIQSIQNGIPRWKANGSCLIVIAPVIQLKPEIETFFNVLDFPLPSEDELFKLQIDLGGPHNIKPNKKAARTAKGLTEFETETVYALSLIEKGYFSSKVISEQKSQMIRKSGLMEIYQPSNIKDVGGLDSLKSYIRSRAKAYLPGNNHLPKPKGLLLLGIPGVGKSLSSKAAASMLGWPLIKLNIGALKNSLVGESERRMREATKIIDAFGNAVIWIDEIDKCFAGTKSSGETDGGTTANMFGHFLTWVNETTSPVLIMATANNISTLPPELIRAGRFDSIFYTDLPTTPERIEIIKIMNRKHGSDIPLSFVDKLQGYTGAEIEQLSKDSLFDGLDQAYAQIVPLSRTMREEIQTLRDWAKSRARLANTPEKGSDCVRKIQKGPRVSVLPSSTEKPYLN